MQKFKKPLIIFVIIFVALGIIKNPLIKMVVTIGASAVTGAPVHIDSLAVGVFKHAVRVKGFRMYNPKGFPKEVMIDVPEVSVDYKPLSFISGKPHLPLLVLNMKEMVIIKNKDGALNVDSLKVAQQPENKEAKVEQAKKEKPKKSFGTPLEIDLMKLNIGRVVYKDFSQGEQPVILVYDIGLKDKTFENIKSAEQLATLVMVQGMGPVGLKSAGIYAAATIVGVGFLPAGVAGVLMGDDDSVLELKQKYDKVYDSSLEILNRIGEVISEDKGQKLIKAKVQGSDIKLEFSKKDSKLTEVKVSARRKMLPKPEVAGGVLYQIEQELN